MILRSILFGGAMAVAFAGAGFAQQAKPDDAQQTQTHRSTAKTMHHARRMHHRMHHRLLHTAALHVRSSPAERSETRDLNLQEVRTMQYGSGPQYMRQYGQPAPGQNTGFTPANRIPNGTPYQTAAPAGGHADTSSIDQAHAR